MILFFFRSLLLLTVLLPALAAGAPTRCSALTEREGARNGEPLKIVAVVPGKARPGDLVAVAVNWMDITRPGFNLLVVPVVPPASVEVPAPSPAPGEPAVIPVPDPIPEEPTVIPIPDEPTVIPAEENNLTEVDPGTDTPRTIAIPAQGFWYLYGSPDSCPARNYIALIFRLPPRVVSGTLYFQLAQTHEISPEGAALEIDAALPSGEKPDWREPFSFALPAPILTGFDRREAKPGDCLLAKVESYDPRHPERNVFTFPAGPLPPTDKAEDAVPSEPGDTSAKLPEAGANSGKGVKLLEGGKRGPCCPYGGSPPPGGPPGRPPSGASAPPPPKPPSAPSPSPEPSRDDSDQGLQEDPSRDRPRDSSGSRRSPAAPSAAGDDLDPAPTRTVEVPALGWWMVKYQDEAGKESQACYLRVTVPEGAITGKVTYGYDGLASRGVRIVVGSVTAPSVVPIVPPPPSVAGTAPAPSGVKKAAPTRRMMGASCRRTATPVRGVDCAALLPWLLLLLFLLSFPRKGGNRTIKEVP